MLVVPAWRMVVGAFLFFVLASLTSFTGLGCASAPTFPRSASPGAIDRVLGGAPEIVVTGHVADALKDPLWESSKATFFADIDRLTRSPDAKRALASIDRIELYVRLSSPTRVVAIVRDVPATLTPEVLLARDGSPAYRSESTLSSGVREYAPHPGDHGPVFVLPNHDWVFADDVSSPAVAAVLASGASSSAFPGPSANGRSGLLAARARTLVRLGRHADAARAAEEAYAAHESCGATYELAELRAWMHAQERRGTSVGL